MTLTVERIHQVADELSSNGNKPTLAAVRTTLGSGSFTTISEAMKTWREENKEAQVLEQVDLPSSIDERLRSLGVEVWQVAIGLANDRLSKERELLETTRKSMTHEVEELCGAVKTLESEQVELLSQLDELEKNHRLKMQEARSKEECNANAIADLERTTQGLELSNKNLEEENLKLNEQLAKTAQSLKAETSELMKMTVQREKFKEKAETSSKELIELKQTSAVMKDDFAGLRGEFRAISNERDRLLQQNKSVVKSNAIIELENERLIEKYNSMFPKFTLSTINVPNILTNSLIAKWLV